jgi:hypothetical protein
MNAGNIILETLKKTVAVIENLKISYCLFGGLAMQAYKRIRATLDVDIMAALGDIAENDFIVTMEKSGFKLARAKGIIEIKGFKFFRFLYAGKDDEYGLDIFVDIALMKGEFQQHILRRRKQFDFSGSKIHIASCEDLILLKILAQRPLDNADAEALLEQNTEDLDKGYLMKQARTLGINRQLQSMLGDH